MAGNSEQKQGFFQRLFASKTPDLQTTPPVASNPQQSDKHPVKHEMLPPSQKKDEIRQQLHNEISNGVSLLEELREQAEVTKEEKRRRNNVYGSNFKDMMPLYYEP